MKAGGLSAPCGARPFPARVRARGCAGLLTDDDELRLGPRMKVLIDL